MAVQASSIAKTFSNTYLYNMNTLDYEKQLVHYMMQGEEINKGDESFEDVRYDVKRRQISNSLVKVLDSKNTKLMLFPKPLPKAFKVFVAKDIKGDGKTKVFIDCRGVVDYKDGKYVCSNVDILISYLVSAMASLIYHSDPKRIIMRDEINKAGSKAFSLLFTNIIDYLYKISTVSDVRNKCLYLSSLYYQVNILNKEMSDSMRAIARRNAGISEREEEVLLMQVDDDTFKNIKLFIDFISHVLRLPKLTTDAFLEKWLFLYGTGTHFALELFPAFSTMMTNCYVGAYLNNQKTIEKLIGRSMTDFSLAVLRIGSELV